MKNKRRLAAIISLILVLTTLVALSVYAWFGQGDSAKMHIIAGATDIVFNLYHVADFNYDGVCDGDMNLPDFYALKTKVKAVNDELQYNGNILLYNEITSTYYAEEARNIEIFSGVDPDGKDCKVFSDKGDNRLYLYPIETNEIEDILDETEPNADHTIENYYPSKTVTFAISIRSTSRNIGSTNLTFTNLTSNTGTLAEVTSLNIGNNKKLLYDPNEADGSEIKIIDTTAVPIDANEVVWVFFSIKFEDIATLNKYFETKTINNFENVENLNEYNKTELPVLYKTIPLIVIQYELHEIIKEVETTLPETDPETPPETEVESDDEETEEIVDP